MRDFIVGLARQEGRWSWVCDQLEDLGVFEDFVQEACTRSLTGKLLPTGQRLWWFACTMARREGKRRERHVELTAELDEALGAGIVKSLDPITGQRMDQRCHTATPEHHAIARDVIEASIRHAGRTWTANLLGLIGPADVLRAMRMQPQRYSPTRAHMCRRVRAALSGRRRG